MTDYIRRLVSGDKARFKDGRLDLELGTRLQQASIQESC
jgi:hypothetical protein